MTHRIRRIAIGLTVLALCTIALWIQFDGDRVMHQGPPNNLTATTTK